MNRCALCWILEGSPTAAHCAIAGCPRRFVAAPGVNKYPVTRITGDNRSARTKEIAACFEAGRRLPDVAKEFGITEIRARQIRYEAKKRLEGSPRPRTGEKTHGLEL